MALSVPWRVSRAASVGPHNHPPPSTTIFELVTQIVMGLQRETDTIISARDAQALYAAIFTGLEKTKTTVKQEKHYYYYYF